MANSGSRDDLFRRYLTRNLTGAERESLSGRLLSEPELSDELAEFEAEWIDARARGELSAAEAAEVDAYLAQTGQQHRLATGRRLAATTTLRAPRRRVPVWVGVAAAAILSIALWQTTRRVESPPTSGATTPNPGVVPAFAVLLTPGTRSAEPRRVALPPGTGQIEFKLALDAPLPAGVYRVTVQGAAGPPVLTVTPALAPAATSLSFTAPASPLVSGSYRVLVAPASNPDEPVNVYSFELRKLE